MSVLSEKMPSPTIVPAPLPAPSGVHPSWLSRLRLVLAIGLTTLLPYYWGRALVVYSQWDQIERPTIQFMLLVLAGVMVLNFRLANKFASRNTARWTVGIVCVLWTAFYAYLMVAYNGDRLASWLVFAGFFPATLWVLWTAWMFFLPLRWTVRAGVLGVLLAAMVPYLTLYEITDMTGDTRLNFTLRNQRKSSLLATTTGEAKAESVKLISNPLTDFPAFQGPDRSAVLKNVKLAKNWKEHPPREIWRVPCGGGWSSFAVVGALAFTQEQRGDKECVVARDIKTGHDVWVHSDDANLPKKATMGGPGPRSTPTIHDGRVYTVGATGILNCLDGATGHVVWSKNMVDDNSGSIAFHGVCGSPLILDELVIVAPTGRAEASLAAYKREDGKRVWAKGHDDAAYASPMLTTILGTSQILNYTSKGLTAHDPRSGTVLWHFDWSNSEGVISSQPVVQAGAPDQVFLSTGYGKGSELIKVSRDAGGNWSAAAAWPSPSRHMKTTFTTAVLRGDYLYGLDEGIMQCLDVKTGEQKWKKGRYGHGQILLVDDLIIVQTEAGLLTLIEANPKTLVELGNVQALSTKSWSCPALAGKNLLVRNDQEAVCYEVELSTK